MAAVPLPAHSLAHLLHLPTASLGVAVLAPNTIPSLPALSLEVPLKRRCSQIAQLVLAAAAASLLQADADALIRALAVRAVPALVAAALAVHKDAPDSSGDGDEDERDLAGAVVRVPTCLVDS